MLIQCYQISNYTSIFVQRTNSDTGCMSTWFSELKPDTVTICDEIAGRFERMFLEHYMRLATLSLSHEKLLDGSYKIEELGFMQPKINVIESDNIPKGSGLKITLESRPAIYLCYLGKDFVRWRVELGSGYSERFNLKYSGSVLDGMLEGANV